MATHTRSTDGVGRLNAKRIRTESSDFDHTSINENPPQGKTRLYARSDNILYTRTSAGVETAVGAGGGGGGETNRLVSSGGEESLVGTLAAPNLGLKGLTAGTNITLTPSATDITIAATTARLASDVTFLTVAGSTFATAQEVQNVFHSSAWVDRWRWFYKCWRWDY